MALALGKRLGEAVEAILVLRVYPKVELARNVVGEQARIISSEPRTPHRAAWDIARKLISSTWSRRVKYMNDCSRASR